MRRLALSAVYLLAGLAMAILVTPSSAADAPQGKQRVYIGTNSGDKSRGIYRCELDLATGMLKDLALAAEAVNSSFLALHPIKPYLFSVTEVNLPDGKKTGGVAAYAIDEASGDLQLLNKQPCGGEGPCHLIVDRAGTHVLVANNAGGSAAVLPISPDGKLLEVSSVVQHIATRVNDRMKNPHPHSINLSPVGRFAYVADAGLDKVFIYRYDAERGTLTENDPPFGVVAPDAAPRHFTFHPNGRQAYVINEHELSVTVFKYDARNGSLTPTQTISTLPAGTENKNYSTAEVVVHPSGKFLYGSNRGHDTIAAFQVDPRNGQLTAVGHFAQGAVKVPRNFNIDPTGTYLLLEGQASNNIVVFRIDLQTGLLTPTGSSIEVGHPVCVKFLRL